MKKTKSITLENSDNIHEKRSRRFQEAKNSYKFTVIVDL